MGHFGTGHLKWCCRLTLRRSNRMEAAITTPRRVPLKRAVEPRRIAIA
jgi:hypothetical protein